VLSAATVRPIRRNVVVDGCVTFANLDREMALWRNHAGTAALARILAHRDLGRDAPDSPLKVIWRDCCCATGFPRPCCITS